MRCRIGRLPVQTPVGVRSSLGTQPCYETLGDLMVDIRTNVVIKNLRTLKLSVPSAVAEGWRWGSHGSIP